jgi:hypothetical protein
MPSWKKVLISGSDASLSSLYVTNDVTASIFSGSFVGDGSGLTNITFDIGEEASYSEAFTNQSSITVNHFLAVQYPLVQVYESGSNEQIIPLTVKVLDSSSIQVSFTENVSGYVVVAKGGHVVQGTVENASQLNGQPASYYLDYSNFTNIPSGLVSSSSQLTSSYDSRYILSGSITAADWNTLLNRPVGIVSSSAQIIPLLPTGTVSGSSQVSYTGLSNIPSGIVSGSSQVIGILSSLNTYTSSNDTTNTNQNNRLTSLETASGSAIGRLNNIETFTSSINNTIKGQLDTNTVISGSSQVQFLSISGTPSGLVSGSSQISYPSISNIPSGIVSGAAQITPLLPTGTVSGSSQVVGILSSLNSYTASNDTTNTTQNNRLDQLSTASGSAIGRLDNLETFSGSVNTKFSTLSTYTSSNDTTNTTQNTRLDLLSTFSGSANSRLSNLETFTSSINTTIKTQLDANTVISGSSQVSYTGLSNIPSEIVSSSSQLTSSLDLRYALSGSIGGGSGEFYTTTNTPFRSGSNTDVDIGTEAVITVATSSFSSAFFDYVILSGSNSRAGTVVSVWNGNTIEFAETSTKSIGTTTDVNLSVTLSSGDVVLNATTTTNDWTVKALSRML